ncbi:methyl-accepting chemotaxis protein [Consotaella salsifontis]|uniref:methyl-accepting chemotaxis protein n=1 Tax=Consotaella salsifontis TaxID=1365950 RepID=UPI001FD92AA9|nr:methyl-accepting chemotaxis protein [Consotaella salsifontis]
MQDRTELLHAQVASARSIAESFQALAASGAIPADDAQSYALKAIARIRYGADGYVYVLDYDARVLAHADASMVGKSLYAVRDAEGSPVFQNMVSVAKGGGGYTAYQWPREAGADPEPKLSYSAAVPEWGWVIGTGAYTNDFDQLFWEKVLAIAPWIAVILIVLGTAGWFIARGIARPLSAIAGTAHQLAAGDKSIAIPHRDRSDEVGDMAQAVETFRLAAIEQDRLAAEAAEARHAQEAEKARQAAEERAKAQELSAFVADIEQGFAQLADGDLTVRLARPVAADYEVIRAQFNGSVETLEATFGSIVGSIGSIRSGLGEINQASNDLAQRTEQQAASLEETVAALGQVTRAVNDTAEGASRAQASAQTAQKNAEKGGAIVGQAVEAMSEIERSSEEIGKIIGVIDEIAFQTNLLALNAGVEAARAGEAGKGFAVVAQEVRALAQRSAEAAKEIKDLISKSGEQVGRGVELVTASGKSLEQIVSEVAAMSAEVSEIARSAREQAVSLKEVSQAADQMDKVTQQNAAMVEETTAAAQSLAAETDNLAQLIAQFRTAASAGHQTQGARTARRQSAPPVLRAATPIRPAAAKAAPRPASAMKATGTDGAPAKSGGDDGWEEF